MTKITNYVHKELQAAVNLRIMQRAITDTLLKWALGDHLPPGSFVSVLDVLKSIIKVTIMIYVQWMKYDEGSNGLMHIVAIFLN